MRLLKMMPQPINKYNSLIIESFPMLYNLVLAIVNNSMSKCLLK